MVTNKLYQEIEEKISSKYIYSIKLSNNQLIYSRVFDLRSIYILYSFIEISLYLIQNYVKK